MNTDFYEDLETNFECAYNLCEQTFSHENLLSMLKDGNIPQKQIAALKFDEVKSFDDAKALMSNLTGCDGKIREAVALKIYQTLINSPESKINFIHFEFAKIFADATIDINANICRLVVDSVKLLREDKAFIKEYTDSILSYTLQALDELDKFIFRDKKYVINKQLFKLYWCLESLKFFYTEINLEQLHDILKRSAQQKEYTVREKAAEIAVLSDDFSEIRNLLEKDSNYYVRAVFLNH